MLENLTMVRLTFLITLFFTQVLACAIAENLQNPNPNSCLDCHLEKQHGFAAGHSFAQHECTVCHACDPLAAEQQGAHLDLIAFPGNLDNAERTCGQCHARHVSTVLENGMHRGSGMVETTRTIIDDANIEYAAHNLQSLGHSPADSLLRKLCASCHLGQNKKLHRIDVTRDRGGGCLACHLNQQGPAGHPALSRKVEDGRCFGCHSRSSRISLNYAGLAEVDAAAAGQNPALSRLLDGRLVAHKPADIHQQAGMACIDCHTTVELMGDATAQQPPDIQCTDCHANRNRKITLQEFPPQLESFKSKLLYQSSAGQRFLTTTGHGTPLWHIEVREQRLLLHRKLDGVILEIPPMLERDHGGQHHARLGCDACHAQWAPQCTGCHISMDPSAQQWDHVEQAFTAGRWIETRWGIKNDLPTLGIDEHGKIRPFIPGMIMTMTHPTWEQQKFVRRFSVLAPHTTGSARSCESCHLNAEAIGLGQGQLHKRGDEWTFSPEQPLLSDHLPADAWTGLDNPHRPHSAKPLGPRPFNASEIRRILEADLNHSAE